MQPVAPSPAPPSDPLLDAARRALATLRASLSAALWDDEAGRVAHARTLVMLGREADATAHLAAGGLPSAIALVYLADARGDVEAAIAHALAAAARFPERAAGFRSSAASMLSACGRHAEALALVRTNLAAEPEVEAWHELEAHLLELLADAPEPA